MTPPSSGLYLGRPIRAPHAHPCRGFSVRAEAPIEGPPYGHQDSAEYALQFGAGRAWPLVRHDGYMTANAFYSDRVNGETPRTLQALPTATADGLLELVMARQAGNWLAAEFPERCPDPDKSHIFGTNMNAFEGRAKALIPKLQIPLWHNRGEIADDTVFDLLELVGRYLAWIHR